MECINTACIPLVDIISKIYTSLIIAAACNAKFCTVSQPKLLNVLTQSLNLVAFRIFDIQVSLKLLDSTTHFRCTQWLLVACCHSVVSVAVIVICFVLLTDINILAKL